MARNKRNHNHRLLKGRRSYLASEIAQELDVHVQTIRGWAKKGLSPIDDSRPSRFMGQAVKDFLRETKAKRRIKLAPNEFYCPRCKCPTKALDEAKEIVFTKKTLGSHGAMQIIIRALCCECRARLHRFSSTALMQTTSYQEQQKGLNGHESPCLNTHFEKESNL